MPFYLKDSLNGKFPMISDVKLDDPRFVEITEAEWDVLRQAGSTEDHPYSPYILNRDAMTEAAKPFIGLPGHIPDPPASGQTPPTAPDSAPAPTQGVIQPEVK